MYEIRFSLTPTSFHAYPLGSSCFYIVGTYSASSSKSSGTPSGTGNFQTWINGSNSGIGLMTIELVSDGLFYLITEDRYEDGVFRHDSLGLAGGVLDDRCVNKSLERGSVSFAYNKKQVLDMILRAKILRPDAPENIPYYQNFVLTDPEIYTNDLVDGDPDSVFRVGQLQIRDPVSNHEQGLVLFENYSTIENDQGIGISAYITKNQILFSILSLQYSSSVIDPDSTVAIRAITPAGQEYMKTLIQGQDRATLNGDNYFETITGVSRNIPKERQTIIDCVVRDLEVNIFELQPDQPKAVVRIGTAVLLNNATERIPIGTANFQSYVTTEKAAIGMTSIQLQGRPGRLFGLYVTELKNPTETYSDSARIGLVAGQAYFDGLINGYVDLKAIPGSDDYSYRIVYTLQ